ncbi:methionyl-tRNA formyltransferase [Sulfurimonas sp. HSL-3221]|uniref:methionyl-tRNA formyltransferase n=1 Tax=Thiomicrolovo sulfuroxydans TaxID=2894755 RepID=UPI001E3803EC|nr:methionyl-tRNA formyltransferase [Sulfurimonas sp. HSL-3221]UFS63312.1 methionyl-tRNA formyltransferase [Sulfurimonas sp. HSL-3221]
MKVIFMGTPDYASRILETLIAQDDIEVVAAYTQPDKPVGRKKVMTPPPVKTVAEAAGIPVYQPDRLRDEVTVETLQAIPCDYIVVAAYGQILPKAVLAHAPCINLHASILPQYRGASPIQQSLLNGDKETGVTAMLMEEGLDTGPILLIERIAIGDDETVGSLFERLTDLAAEMTPQVLRSYPKLTPVPQNDADASLCKKISKADGEVAFDDARSLYNKYRAFTPWPGVYLESGLKLTKMHLAEEDGGFVPGRILAVEKSRVKVGCSMGALWIETVQPPSKKAMAVVDYLNGKRLGLDDTLA